MERFLVVAFCDRGDLSVNNKELDLDQSFEKYTVISLNHPLLNSRHPQQEFAVQNLLTLQFIRLL